MYFKFLEMQIFMKLPKLRTVSFLKIYKTEAKNPTNPKPHTMPSTKSFK